MTNHSSGEELEEPKQEELIERLTFSDLDGMDRAELIAGFEFRLADIMGLVTHTPTPERFTGVADAEIKEVLERVNDATLMLADVL